MNAFLHDPETRRSKKTSSGQGDDSKNGGSVLYVQTSDQPERQYSPLVLAQTAKAMDLKPKLYYLGMGLKMLRPGQAEKVRLGDFPSLREMIDQCLQMGIEIMACEASKRMLGWDTVELIPGVKVVGAATLNDLALDADATMWF